jgi:tetratricopeptide (TPR) repeat protein
MGREANQLINAGRQAFRPTQADRARLMAALAGTATLTIGAELAASTAERSLSSVFSLAPAARLLATVALPLAAAGAYGWHATQSSPAEMQRVRPATQAPAVVTPKVAETPVPAADAELAPPSEPSAPVAPERVGSPVGESTKPGNEIRQEVALLSKAQAALSRGRPQEALEALSEHALRFPRGVLSEERAATRARTLCALGRRQEAESELTRIEKLNPTSAYLARARESCGSR